MRPHEYAGIFAQHDCRVTRYPHDLGTCSAVSTPRQQGVADGEPGGGHSGPFLGYFLCFGTFGFVRPVAFGRAMVRELAGDRSSGRPSFFCPFDPSTWVFPQ